MGVEYPQSHRFRAEMNCPGLSAGTYPSCVKTGGKRPGLSCPCYLPDKFFHNSFYFTYACFFCAILHL